MNLTFIFTLCISTNPDVQWLPLDEVFDNITRPHQLQVVGNHLYMLANRESLVVRYTIGENDHLIFDKIIATKGDGPGELSNPARLSATENTLIVKDDQGFSFYRNGTTFINRMKYFFRVNAISVADGKLFILGLKPKGETVIEAFKTEGELIRSTELNLLGQLGDVGKKFDNFSIRQFSRGSLHVNGENLLYLTDLFGIAIKIDQGGHIIGSRDLSSDFGPIGQTIASLNGDNLKKGFTKTDGGLEFFLLLTTSCVATNSLFVPFVPDGFPDLVAPNTAGYINVFDTNTLSLKRKIDLPKKFRVVHSITIKETEQGDYLAFAIIRDDDEKKIVTARLSKF